MTNTELLRQYIKDSGLKVTYIAEQLDLSRQGLYRKINGETDFKLAEAEKLCLLLGIKTQREKMAVFFAEL